MAVRTLHKLKDYINVPITEKCLCLVRFNSPSKGGFSTRQWESFFGKPLEFIQIQRDSFSVQPQLEALRNLQKDVVYYYIGMYLPVTVPFICDLLFVEEKWCLQNSKNRFYRNGDMFMLKDTFHYMWKAWTDNAL
jgi:hypothetical protein